MTTTITMMDALWLKALVSDHALIQEDFIVYYDNQSTICLSKNQMCRERIRHIDVGCIKYMRWYVNKKNCYFR